MKIIIDEVIKFDIQPLKKYVSEYERNQVDMEAGQQGYKLYAYLSHMFDDIKICELGTRYGTSAIMFSSNPKNQVDTYDIRRCEKEPDIPNVKFHIKDMFLDENIVKLLEYKIIFVCVTDQRSTHICQDGDHAGVLEKKLYDFLVDNNWNGILIMDAIGSYWPDMQDMWNALPHNPPKYDVTHMGHAAGTGIVDFTDELGIFKWN
jgi:hypothetical protein